MQAVWVRVQEKKLIQIIFYCGPCVSVIILFLCCIILSWLICCHGSAQAQIGSERLRRILNRFPYLGIIYPSAVLPLGCVFCPTWCATAASPLCSDPKLLITPTTENFISNVPLLALKNKQPWNITITLDDEWHRKGTTSAFKQVSNW